MKPPENETRYWAAKENEPIQNRMVGLADLASYFSNIKTDARVKIKGAKNETESEFYRGLLNAVLVIEKDFCNPSSVCSSSFKTNHSCEVCGGMMMIQDNGDRLIYDDQEAWCELCEFRSRTVVDDQGNVGIQM